MKCKNCGAEVTGKFCSECGKPLLENKNQENLYNSNYSAEKETFEKNRVFLKNVKKQSYEYQNNKKNFIAFLMGLLAIILFIVFGQIYDYTHNIHRNGDYLSYDNNDEDYLDYDDEEIEAETPTEASKIEYEEVTLKKLYNNYFEYNNEYVKTTIKVTKINKDDAEYSYTVYDTDEFDKVTIKFKNVYPKKKKIKKGGYLTVEGLCNYKEYDYNSKLTITVDADRRVPKDKSLFKKLGAEKKTPQEYLNALEKAKSYSDNLHMSKKAIYEQLTSEYGENFTADAAQYAVDNLVADYNQNALEKAKSYYKDMNMSKQSVYEQLISEYGEQFTSSEAQYAIDHLDD